jgi:hypothetical protein
MGFNSAFKGLKATNMHYVHGFQLVTCSKYAPSWVWNSQLILCGEIMAVLSERHATHTNAQCGQNRFFFYFYTLLYMW